MATEIWVSNVIIGNNIKQVILEKIAVKRLPVEVLITDEYFIKSLQSKMGKKLSEGKIAWDKLPIHGTTGMPNIKIIYLKYLGDVAQESDFEYI